MSSLTNFAVTIFIARSLLPAQFGAFSLAYVTYSFVLHASRGLATDPLLVRFSNADLPAWRRAVANCTGTAAAVGMVSGVCVLGVAALLGGTARSAFLALGLTLPALMLQDSWRYSFFAIGRGSQAFLNDLIWASALVPGLLIVRVTGHQTVFWFVLVWGASAAVAAAVGPLQARVIPRLLAALEWVSRHRDLSLRYFAENTSISGAGQLRTYALGIITGLAAVGYLQAASTLLGPFLVIFMGMSLVTVPEAARVLRKSPQHLRLFCVLVGVGLAVICLAWGLALMVLLPRGLGNDTLGPIWRPAYKLILPLTLSLMGACVTAGATAGLHALGASPRSLRAQIFSSSLYLSCGIGGALIAGLLGAVYGAILATWVGALLWWWQLRVALRESEHVPTGEQPGTAASRHRSTIRPGPRRKFVPHRREPQPAQPFRPGDNEDAWNRVLRQASNRWP
jgi:O-antigen/teichoic acid export membrane protein